AGIIIDSGFTSIKSMVQYHSSGCMSLFFKEKYPKIVKVYYVGYSLQDAWSKEFCGGPHVLNTGEIGQFIIQKEEGVGAGVRRIRATILP
ncbi:MAG: hypothetical protein ACP5QN_02145, partial [Minisyncoccia bacterium]